MGELKESKLLSSSVFPQENADPTSARMNIGSEATHLCPKRERCIHGAECIETDVFRGEYLCFESKALNIYEHEQERHRQAYITAKMKKGRKL